MRTRLALDGGAESSGSDAPQACDVARADPLVAARARARRLVGDTLTLDENARASRCYHGSACTELVAIDRAPPPRVSSVRLVGAGERSAPARSVL